MTTKFTIDAHVGGPVELEFTDPRTGNVQERKFVRPNATHDDYVHSGRSVAIREIQPSNDAPDEADAAWFGLSRDIVFSEKQIADDPILKFFSYAHLPQHLQEASAPFASMASRIVTTLPRNAERTIALRKLLECKDAAVRAAIT